MRKVAKVPITITIDREAKRLLLIMGGVEHRSVSSQVNNLIYEAAEQRGLSVNRPASRRAPAVEEAP